MMLDNDRLILIDQKFCLGFPVNEGEILEAETIPKAPGLATISSKGFKLNLPQGRLPLPFHKGNATALLALLKGEETRNILNQFQKELRGSRREDAGHIVLENTIIDEMIEPINSGMMLGFNKIKKLFSNRHVTKLLLCSSEDFSHHINVVCSLSEKLLSLIEKK